jgi:DNA-binding SARP family transcriptional activator
MIRVAVLGPMRIHVDGAAVRVTSAKQRVLLAALAVRAGRVVSFDELAEAVWDGQPPPGWRTAIRNYVMRLRRALGRAGRHIVTRHDGYALEADDGEVDVLSFAARCAEGGALVRARDWGDAWQVLDAGLSMWRGRPFADVPSRPLADAEVPRLEELRLQAAEWRAEAGLHLGRHGELAGELQSLADAHPLRERFSAQLMTALYRCGRPADALAAYQKARAALVAELGVEPGPELADLHQMILTGDPLLAAPGPAPAGAGSLRATCQLPPEVSDLAGREELIGELLAALAPAGTARAAVLWGQPGVGKSALATAVGYRLRGSYPDGQWYVPLGGESAPRDAHDALADLLRCDGVAAADIPARPGARIAMFRARVADRRILLILDGAASAEQAGALLLGTGGSATLVTAARALPQLPAAQHVRVGPLSAGDGVALLTAILGEDRTAAEPAYARRLVQLCAGLPLAIRIAGAKLLPRPEVPVSQLAKRLAYEPTRLDELSTDGLELRSGLRVSYASLAADLQLALRQAIALPVAGFTAADLGASCDGTDGDRLVAGLITADLLEPAGTDGAGQPRYRLRDMIALYAAEQARSSAAAAAARRWPGRSRPGWPARTGSRR